MICLWLLTYWFSTKNHRWNFGIVKLRSGIQKIQKLNDNCDVWTDFCVIERIDCHSMLCTISWFHKLMAFERELYLFWFSATKSQFVYILKRIKQWVDILFRVRRGVCAQRFFVNMFLCSCRLYFPIEFLDVSWKTVVEHDASPNLSKIRFISYFMNKWSWNDQSNVVAKQVLVCIEFMLVAMWLELFYRFPFW